MEILHATARQIDEIMEIYAAARRFMAANGNPTQWNGGYPPRALVEADVAAKKLYVCAENGEILGVFFYDECDDPTYRHIYDGAWRNDRPYGVIHRIAVAAHGRGVAGFCFDACFERCKNLKIDTHRDNLPMQKSLARHGFLPCGTIRLENGEERIAYQRCED